MGMMADNIYNFEGVAEANRLANPNGIHKPGWLTVCNLVESGCNRIADIALESIFSNLSTKFNNIFASDESENFDIVGSTNELATFRKALQAFKANPTRENAQVVQSLFDNSDRGSVIRKYGRVAEQIQVALLEQ